MFGLTEMDWHSAQIPAALITGLVALIVSLLTAAVTFRTTASRAVVDRELAVMKARLDNKTVFAAEETARVLLLYDPGEDETKDSRSFLFLRHRLAGFGDNELRKILVRCGAVQIRGKRDEERWGLPERNRGFRDRSKDEAQKDLLQYLWINERKSPSDN